MYIPEEMKVNKMQHVHMPSNEAYFSRFGQSFPGQQLYTGDDPAPIEKNKVDELDDYQRYAEDLAYEAIRNRQDHE